MSLCFDLSTGREGKQISILGRRGDFRAANLRDVVLAVSVVMITPSSVKLQYHLKDRYFK